MSFTALAWSMAGVGALLSCALMIGEYLKMDTPSWCPIKVSMWGRFVLLHLAGVVWIIFSNV